MSERNKLDVRIGGKEYTIVSTDSEEYMHKVASFVDKKMNNVIQLDSRMSTSMVAVLTAINVADEYMKLKMSEDNIISELMQYTNEIEKLKAELKELKELQTHKTATAQAVPQSTNGKGKPQLKKTDSVNHH